MKIVACDPGESFGHCVGEDNVLEYAGTVDMWEFVHALGAALLPDAVMGEGGPGTGNVELRDRLESADHVVVEDWALYPWVLEQGGLNYDKCRTARAIGAVEFICRASGTRPPPRSARGREPSSKCCCAISMRSCT